jgi:hypothetical protein
LVEHFGGGNRSACLRATSTVMESLRRVQRMRALQTPMTVGWRSRESGPKVFRFDPQRVQELEEVKLPVQELSSALGGVQ